MSNAITGRPWRLTEEMRLAAARETATDLLKARCIEPDMVEDSVRDIAKVGRGHEDGYELAKRLDSSCYWDCDLMMAEELDNWAANCRNEIERAEKAWFEATKPEPPFPVGTRVQARNGVETITGTIDEIYTHGVARYCIKQDGDPEAEKSHRRWIVKWEDVVPLTDEVGAVASGSERVATSPPPLQGLPT
jgi:hypothetical protein